jgi:hypothetical protein
MFFLSFFLSLRTANLLLDWANPLQGPLEGMGPENRYFLSPKMATHIHKKNHMSRGHNDIDGGKYITRAIQRGVP